MAADKICLPDIILSAETKRKSVENLSLMILMHCSSGTVVFLFCFIIWVLWPIKIISLILSRVNHKHGAKMGDPREKPPDHLQAELGHSLTCDPSKARTQSGEMTSDLDCYR